jgi:hypothetical protein
MPRKSASEIAMSAFVPGGKGERPDPPPGMPEAAAAVWRDAVSSMKARHFMPETFALLTRYCRAMGECARLETELIDLEVTSAQYDRLLKQRNSTAAVALSYARALRLTPKSHVETRGGARDPHRTVGPKPWELDYAPSPGLRRLTGRDAGDEDDPSKPWNG